MKDYIEGWTFEKRKSGFGYLADNILDTTDSVIFRTAFVEYVAQALARVKYLLLEQTQFEKRCNGLVIEMNQIMIGAEMYESVCKDRYVISRFYMYFCISSM